MKSLVEFLNGSLDPNIRLIIFGLITFLSYYILIKITFAILKKIKGKYLSLLAKIHAFKELCMPLTLFLFMLTSLQYIEGNENLPDWLEKPLSLSILKSAVIVVTYFLSVRILHIVFRYVRRKMDFSYANNLDARKRATRLQFIEKIIIVGLFVITVSSIFMSFETLEKVGTSILASAGVAGIILGLAARESVSNLIAGFHIAFTQPLRIDDAVVVENEWGWIEEINLTYVVVRIWDKRRLVLPIKYFTEKPFQNWTRTSAQILGSVELYLDYSVNLDNLRKKFEEILVDHEKWDKEVKVLQVIDCTEKTMKVRALVSASNSPDAWDLRCDIREGLLKYLADKEVNGLPKIRTDVLAWKDVKNE